jgi:drug/metabolite transporter superfamily protein YnfA
VSPRVATVVVGVVSVVLGLAGLVYPERVIGLLGFTVQNASHTAAALGEVRATYGGIFLVLGVFTLMAAPSPWNHRSRLVFLALIWLGACTARLFGVWVDGNPGLPGWAPAMFEVLMGGTLLFASQASAPPAVVSAPATMSTTTA